MEKNEETVTMTKQELDELMQQAIKNAFASKSNNSTANEVKKLAEELKQGSDSDPVIAEIVTQQKRELIVSAISSVKTAFNKSNRTSIKYGNVNRIIRDLGKALESLEDLSM